MGLSSKTQKTNQTTTATPTVPSWLQTPYQDVASRIGGFMNSDPSSMTTPANSNQQASWARAAEGSGTVAPGLLSETDLSKYMNPYTQNVIDTSTNDLNRARQMAINGNSASATLGGGNNAWLGDRAGVADAETNRGFLDSVASFTANLRNTGYNNAQQGAQFDIGNKLSADEFNVNSRRADTDALAKAGADERAIAQENNPQNAYARQMAMILAMLNGIPISQFTGQTSNQTGKTTVDDPMGTIAGLLQAGGSLASGIGAL